MKLLALSVLAASVVAQNVGGVDLSKYDKCLTTCLQETAKAVSCDLEKPECYCGTNNLSIATSTYALCISKACTSLDASVMASGVYGQICTNVATGGSTNNQGVNSAPPAAASSGGNATPSGETIEPTFSSTPGAASGTAAASSASGASSAAAASASASAPAKPSSAATPLGLSALAVGGAVAAFLA